jgi:hypothetical protein
VLRLSRADVSLAEQDPGRDGNSGTGMIFYPRMAPVPDPNRDGYETGIFSHPQVT